MKKSIDRLKRLNFNISDIRTHPNMLLQSDFQLLNNFQRLQEVGFSEVTAYRLANFQKIMSRSVHFNQSFNFLPRNINILQNIFATANVPYEDETSYDLEMRLEAVHRIALRRYLLTKVQYESSDIDEMWYNYPILKRRSLQSIVELVQILERTYNIPVKLMPKYILLMHSEEIQELLNEESVSGIDIKNLIISSPKCTLKKIKDIQSMCHSYNVPDHAIAFSPKLFNMNVDTLKERLDKIQKMKYGHEFLTHMAIGRVILCMGRIKIYAKSQKQRFDQIFNEKFV